MQTSPLERAEFTTANAFDGLEIIDASYNKQNFAL